MAETAKEARARWRDLYHRLDRLLNNTRGEYSDARTLGEAFDALKRPDGALDIDLTDEEAWVFGEHARYAREQLSELKLGVELLNKLTEYARRKEEQLICKSCDGKGNGWVDTGFMTVKEIPCPSCNGTGALL